MLCLRVVLPIAVAFVAAVFISNPLAAAAHMKVKANERAQKFVNDHVAKVRPLEIAVALAWWNANTSGQDKDFQEKEKAQNRIDEALANPTVFAELKAIKDEGGIDDTILAREINLLYLTYLEKQVDPPLLKKMAALSNKVEQAF